MIRVLRAFIADESGQDMVEYALMFLAVSIVTVPLLVIAGGSVLTMWGIVSTNLVALVALV